MRDDLRVESPSASGAVRHITADHLQREVSIGVIMDYVRNFWDLFGKKHNGVGFMSAIVKAATRARR